MRKSPAVEDYVPRPDVRQAGCFGGRGLLLQFFHDPVPACACGGMDALAVKQPLGGMLRRPADHSGIGGASSCRSAGLILNAPAAVENADILFKDDPIR
jgi:hypothetical protein